MRGLRHGSGQKLPVGITLWVETYLGEANFGLFWDFKIFAKCYGFSMGGEDSSVRSEASGGLRDPKGTNRSRYEA